MKKILLTFLILIVSVSLIGCRNLNNTQTNDQEIVVGVAFYPMKEILLLIEDDLKAEGYALKIEEFADYQTPNSLLASKELDANMIQHDYFLQAFNAANNTDLVVVQAIYHAVFALYSKDYQTLDEIPNGSSITLADDATNFSRSLYLLGQAELLSFKDDKKINLTVDDIEYNPKNLQFNDQVPLTSLAQKYNETRLSIMYPTYAKSLDLVGDQQRLYVEKQDDVTKNYAISLVARVDNQNSEKLETLIKYITSDKVRQFLIDEYNWASTPAF